MSPTTARARDLSGHGSPKNEARSPFFCAGMWREWDGVRGTKAEPLTGKHLVFSFLTTDPNDAVRPVHTDAMPALQSRGCSDAWVPGTTYWLALESISNPSTSVQGWDQSVASTETFAFPFGTRRSTETNVLPAVEILGAGLVTGPITLSLFGAGIAHAAAMRRRKAKT